MYRAKCLEFVCPICNKELSGKEIHDIDTKLNYNFKKSGKEWVSYKHCNGFIQIALSYMNEYVLIGYGTREKREVKKIIN